MTAGAGDKPGSGSWVPRSVRSPAGPSGRVDELVAAAVRAAGRSGHLGEEDRRLTQDEAALAGPEWLGHQVAQNAQLTERMTKVLTTGTSGANAPCRQEERLTCRLVDGSYPS